MRTMKVSFIASIGVVIGLRSAAASACDCDPGTFEDRVASADVVFEGRLDAEMALDALPPCVHSGYPSDYARDDFAVTKVWKGDVGATMSVINTNSTCYANMNDGELWIVVGYAFASTECRSETISVNDCSGSVRSSADVLATLGEPVATFPLPPPPDDPTGDDDATTPSCAARPATTGEARVEIVALVVLLASGRSRRTSGKPGRVARGTLHP